MTSETKKLISNLKKEIDDLRKLKVKFSKLGGRPIPPEQHKDILDELFVTGPFKKCDAYGCERDGIYQFLSRNGNLKAIYCEEHKEIGERMRINPKVGSKEHYKITKLKAQLQFAEKLMKLRDKEEKERLKKLIEKIKKDVEKLRPRWEAREKGKKVKRIGQEINIKELNKILNSALKKCQK